MVRITKLECRGLYSYRDPLAVDLSDMVVIVGPNNSGKSNIFRLIRLLADTLSSSLGLKDHEIAKGVNDSCLELRMTLSEAETVKIVDFFSFYYKQDDSNIKFSEYENRAQLVALLDEIAVGVFWKKTAMSGIRSHVEIEFMKIGLKMYGHINSELCISDRFDSEIMESRDVDRTSWLPELLGKLSDHAGAKIEVAGFFRDRRAIAGGSIYENYGEIPEHAKRALADLKSYVNPSSKTTDMWVTLTKIIGKILVRGIVHSPDSRYINGPSVWTMAESLKIPTNKEEDVLGLGDAKSKADQYNAMLEQAAFFKSAELEETLVGDGSNLPSFLFGLKTSPIHANRERFEAVQKAFEDVFRSEKLKFDVILMRQKPVKRGSVSLKPWTHTFPIPEVVVNDGSGEEFPVEDAGAGVGESIYLLALVMGSGDSVVLLDEPSINMHPSLTRAVLEKICSAGENQILIATHSPAIAGFVAFENLAGVLYVRRAGLSSTVRALDGRSFELPEKNRNRLRYIIDPGIFFAKCVILVEGESDKLLLLGIWRRLGLNLKHGMNYNDVMVTPVNGKKNFPTYRKMLDAFGAPYMILADNDAKKLLVKSQTVHKETGEIGGCTILTTNGNLEDLMKDVDRKAYDRAASNNKSKIDIVSDFVEEVHDSGENLMLFRAIFRKAVCLAKGQSTRIC